MPTVANKLANIIVSIEMNNGIDEEVYEPNKADINDEINLEEVDQFLESLDGERRDIFNNQDNINLDNLKDEVTDSHENVPEEIEISDMSKARKKHYVETLLRLEKISVAPGEKGKFQNWGEDIFLEEKCFPELFPYGVGGYMSQTIENGEENIGFAQYVKHRILSADSKFRRNNAYVFFLLLVKELIQLKRCKQTYLRQATKIPTLTKESLMNVKKEDLSRYNRSFQVFKTMRGTSMYYEDAKKNVMALLRQKGSPSLFVTLSCAEYSWEGLLKEIMEASYGRTVTESEIEKLTIPERNKLISENVVQSTLHFQKRIEKVIKLMTFPKFLDDECPYSVSSYYYRVEFQQRGAPHIHCLLWLEDEEQNPAPTFWNKDSDKNTEDVEEKISKIEKIASTLISASEDEAMCDEHNAELQKYKVSQTQLPC